MKPHTPRLPPAQPTAPQAQDEPARPKEKTRHNAQLRKSRELLWANVPKLIEKAIDEANEGNATHLKVLLELAGLDKGALLPKSAKPAEKTLETILLEQWARDAEDRLAEQAEAETRRRDHDRTGA